MEIVVILLVPFGHCLSVHDRASDLHRATRLLSATVAGGAAAPFCGRLRVYLAVAGLSISAALGQFGPLTSGVLSSAEALVPTAPLQCCTMEHG